MNAIVWILLCLFAAGGVAQCVSWLVCMRGRPRNLRRGYHVIPLHDNPEGMEAQVRYAVSQIQWSGRGGEIILLADMGLSAESLVICQELMHRCGFLYCKGEHIYDAIQGLDDLQKLEV